MSDLPDSIVLGEWRDTEYYALQRAVLRRPATKEELRRLIDGPRVHPFGPNAHMEAVDGQWLVFPSKEAAGV